MGQVLVVLVPEEALPQLREPVLPALQGAHELFPPVAPGCSQSPSGRHMLFGTIGGIVLLPCGWAVLCPLVFGHKLAAGLATYSLPGWLLFGGFLSHSRASLASLESVCKVVGTCHLGH